VLSSRLWVLGAILEPFIVALFVVFDDTVFVVPNSAVPAAVVAVVFAFLAPLFSRY
jgi:hypothetical protein